MEQAPQDVANHRVAMCSCTYVTWVLGDSMRNVYPKPSSIACNEGESKDMPITTSRVLRFACHIYQANRTLSLSKGGF